MQVRDKASIKDLLNAKYDEFCRPDFIENDPISIPHQFSTKEDIEIAGFFSATIAWGQRPTIIKNAKRLMKLMDNAPFEFITQHQPKDLKRFDGFVHRTFNADDVRLFCHSLKNLYSENHSLEDVFLGGIRDEDKDLGNAIHHFRNEFFQIMPPSPLRGTQPFQGEIERPDTNLSLEKSSCRTRRKGCPEGTGWSRTLKHVSDPMKGSAAKRINMYLRWMSRPGDRGVDFGIWERIPTSLLSCPLDVHSGRVARKLGLLKRKQNDWKAVQELDTALREMDPADPVKYDYALFGLGVFEGF